MMRRLDRFALVALVALAAGACDDDGAGADTGPAPDAATLDGASPDGTAPDGTPPDGAPPDGSPPDGAPPDGAPPDGAPPDGAPPDSAPLDAAPPDAAPPDAGEPCEPGATRAFECPDGLQVPWCTCDDGGQWQCAPDPGSACRDPRCDDGTMPLCPMPEPECGEGEIAAIQDNCWSCVNPESCRPWGEPGCALDRDCPASDWCDPCAHGSCPVCEDCVAECVAHGCPSEDGLECAQVRPECGEAGVAVVRDGCWACVHVRTCEPLEPPNECEVAGGYCAHFMDQCREGYEGGPPMGCPLGRSGQCCLPGADECRSPEDCLARFWNIRCLGHWACEGGACQETCDAVGCGDGVCDQAGGESHTSCRQDCGDVPECEAGDLTRYTCPDDSVVPWCQCGPDRGWQCVLEPESECRDTRCDDGTIPICDMIPPVCGEGEIFAHQANCYRCVNPATCLPWGEPQCGPDLPCPPGQVCDGCGSSSCPFCDDCVPACLLAR